MATCRVCLSLKAKKAKIEAQWRNEAGEVITLHGVHDPAQKPTDAPLGAPPT